MRSPNTSPPPSCQLLLFLGGRNSLKKTVSCNYIIITRDGLVRMKGLEPPRPETLDPKSNAATNYATCAGL